MSKEQDNSSIDWHSGFAGGLELGFSRFAGQIEIEREHLLSKKALQIDFLLINKKNDVKIDNSVGHLFRKHNIIEYKNPKDELNIDVVWKVIGYAGIYKSLGKTVNEIPAESISLSIFRSNKPRKLLNDLVNQGIVVDNPYPGVYYVNGLVSIPLQIVIADELTDTDFLALRILKENADENEVRDFILNRKDKYTPGEINDIDAVLRVVASANKELFERMRGEDNMNDVLREIMKDDLLEAEATGEIISTIKFITRKMSKGKTPAEIAEDLDLELDKVEIIYNCAIKYGTDIDPKELYSKMKESALV